MPPADDATTTDGAGRGASAPAFPARADVLAIVCLVAGSIAFWIPRIVRSATTYAPMGSDSFGYFLPAYAYWADRVAGGGFPFWNPYQGGGVPFLAMPQPGALYPARLLTLVTEPARAMGWSAYAHVLLALVGTHALCRQLGASVLGAVAGAIVFTTGFALPAIATPAVLESGAWTPWIAFGVARILSGGGRTWSLLAGVAGAMPLLAGDYQVTLYGVYGIALLALAVVAERRPRPRALAGALGRLAVAGALAAAAGAPQILTTYAWSAQTMRQTQALSDFRLMPLFTEAAWWNRLTVFFVRHTSSDLAHLSVPVVVLAVVGLVGARAAGVVLGFGAVGTALLALARPQTLALAVYKLIPGFQTFRFPARIVFLTSLFVAVLAGLGVTSIGRVRRLRPPRRRLLVETCLVGVVLGFLVWPYRHTTELPWTAPPSDTAPDPRFFPGRIRPPADARVWAPATRLDLRLSTFVRQGMRQRVRVLQDYEPLSSQRLNAFLAAVAGRREPYAWFDGASSGPGSIARPDLLDLVAVRAILTPYDALAATGVPGWAEVEKAGNLGTFTNERALPRAYVAGRVRFVADEAAALGAITGDGFDAHAEVVVVGAPVDGDERSLAAATTAPLVPATIAVDEPERVVVEVAPTRAGVLVLADAFAPGWAVTVDGSPRPLWQANHFVRAVRLRPGDRRVEFRYRAPGFATGVAIAVATWSVVLLGLALGRVRERSARLTVGRSGGMPGA